MGRQSTETCAARATETDMSVPKDDPVLQALEEGFAELGSEGDPVEIAEHAPPSARGYVHVYIGNDQGKTTAVLPPAHPVIGRV